MIVLKVNALKYFQKITLSAVNTLGVPVIKLGHCVPSLGLKVKFGAQKAGLSARHAYIM
jgi:hypothetical protein